MRLYSIVRENDGDADAERQHCRVSRRYSSDEAAYFGRVGGLSEEIIVPDGLFNQVPVFLRQLDTSGAGSDTAVARVHQDSFGPVFREGIEAGMVGRELEPVGAFGQIRARVCVVGVDQFECQVIRLLVLIAIHTCCEINCGVGIGHWFGGYLLFRFVGSVC